MSTKKVLATAKVLASAKALERARNGMPVTAGQIDSTLDLGHRVAMIYPLFSLGLLTAYIYYPQMIRSTMRDPNFDKNAKRMISRCESYFLIAAIIPLLGAGRGVWR